MANQSSPRHHRARVALATGWCCLVLIGALAPTAATATVAPQSETPSPSEVVGIGGSPQFPQGAAFPFVAGSPTPFRASVFLQNGGSREAAIQATFTAPPGVQVLIAGGNIFTLPAGESRKVDFDVVVGSSVVQGKYPVTLSFGQTNVPSAPPGVIRRAPGFSTKFIVDVTSDVGSLIARAESEDDRAPIKGTFTLIYLGSQGNVPLLSVDGFSLTRQVVPGRYRISFVIPGLAQTSQDVTVTRAKTSQVVLRVSGVRFGAVSAKPVQSGKTIVSADLSAEIISSLRNVPGPVVLTVLVRRNGQDVDTVTVSTLASLTRGSSVQNYSYRPTAGFTSGTWSFQYSLKGRYFTIDAPSNPQFVVQGSGFWNDRTRMVAIVALAATLVALVGASWWFILARRRRKKDEDEEQELTPVSE